MVSDEANDESGLANEGPDRCVACGQQITPTALSYSCADCAQRYPPSLLKAMIDPFDYALCLRSGGTIRFESASAHGDWVHLTLQGTDERTIRLPYTFARGMDIRLDEILWCADAPQGS